MCSLLSFLSCNIDATGKLTCDPIGSWLYLSRQGESMRKPKRQSRIGLQFSKRNSTSPQKTPAPRPASAATEVTSEEDVDDGDDGAFSVDTDEGYFMVPADNDMQSVDSSDPDATPEARAEAVFTHVLNRNTFEVMLALDEGIAEVEAQDGYGNTLLVIAAQTNCAPMVLILLERGADINAQNWRGQVFSAVSLSCLLTCLRTRAILFSLVLFLSHSHSFSLTLSDSLSALYISPTLHPSLPRF